jgi:hypothetical protein
MRKILWLIVVLGVCQIVRASSGDPQVKTDDPWYPGELSCSTFERLFKTQAALYERVTGRKTDTDEDKALASWYWRNLHYAHGEEGKCDLFGKGFTQTDWNRDYWTGLFAHGFGLCGTTHAQWNAEMEALLGHCRSRCVGVSGHNSFEVYLTGGAYGAGQWVLLDHDISTVIFAPDGSRLLSIAEIMPQLGTLKDPKFKPERQRGWRVSGLEDGDAGGVYTSFTTAEYLAGYAGPPPMVHLRPGETMRRYLNPGLADGKTFVFWGRNYNEGGIPGPARSRTWVNQPEKMYGSKKGTGYAEGQMRYANAVFTYKPSFTDQSYREGVVAANDKQITFEFRSPYVIACTPPNSEPWGIYDTGGKNGLVISGKIAAELAISVDAGGSWKPAGGLTPDRAVVDATDLVKGHNQYWLRISPAAGGLRDADLTIRTVCQCNVATLPHLHDGINRVTFESSGLALQSAGPTFAQAQAHVVDGKLDSPRVTLELEPPRGERSVRLYAASWQASGNPPAPAVKYQIEYSADAGKTWTAVVKDWQITRRAPEPADFWSQSFAWGEVELKDVAGPLRVRFRNDGGKTYRKVEAHLAYRVSQPSATEVRFGWRDAGGQMRTAEHVYAASTEREDASWSFDAGAKVRTDWVEYAVK